MEREKVMLVIVIILFGLIVVFFSLNITKKVNFQPEADNSSISCKTLKYNGEGKINLVFFGDNQSVKKYVDSFLKIVPFDTNKEAFNFYYIDNYAPECQLYNGIALLCYSSDIIKKAALCPNDFIVILKDKTPKIRSSSYMNVLSINIEHPTSVLPHEFGHSFADFSEEYVPTELPSNSPNCMDNCSKFGNLKNGCFEGCSRADYYRSVDSGIMRTLSSQQYGLFNENILLSKLKQNAKLTGKSIEEPQCNKEFYLIEGNYSSSHIDILRRTIERGCPGTNGVGSFSYSLILNDGSVANQGEFKPNLIFTDSEEGGEVYNYEGRFLLQIPLIKEAKAMSISQSNIKLSEIRLDDIGARPCKK